MNLRAIPLLSLAVTFGLASAARAETQSPPPFRAFAFYGTQTSGGNLLSGGASWNPRIGTLSVLGFGGLLGAQLLKDLEGTLVPAVDLGVSLGARVLGALRIEAQLTALFAPLEGSDAMGVLQSSTGTIGGVVAYDAPVLLFDGLWVGYRRWLATDALTEYRAGVSFRL